MATGPGLTKSAFVEDYLRQHPEANEKAVNRAWREAGNEGSIGSTTFYRVKGQLDLPGKEAPGGKEAPKPKTTPQKKAPRAAGTGSRRTKSAFVEDQFRRDDRATEDQINRAWQTAGNRDTISSSLISKVKSELGLTGQARPGGDTQAPEPMGRPPLEPPPEIGLGAEPTLDQMEVDIDDLLFRIREMGDYPEVAEALRLARRLLVRKYQG